MPKYIVIFTSVLKIPVESKTKEHAIKRARFEYASKQKLYDQVHSKRTTTVKRDRG